MSDERRIELLSVFARHVGIETQYWDVAGNLHTASVDSLLAVLRIMGHDVDGLGSVAAAVDRYAERESQWVTLPQLVAWLGRPFRFELRLPAGQVPGPIELAVRSATQPERSIGVVDLQQVASTELDDAGGHRRAYAIEVPAFDAVPGVHELWISGIDHGPLRRSVIVAPSRVVGFDPLDRLWGVFLPAYALPGGTGLGAHIGDLGRVAGAIDACGGKVVGTLPLLSAWLDEPYDPSPYAPVSRCFWNELYVDLAALPELAHSAKARDDLDGLHTFGHAANEKSKSFDYRHQHGYVRGVLQDLVDSQHEWPRDLFDAFHDSHHDGFTDRHDYAAFRAYAERMGTGWHQWPAGARDGRIELTDDDIAAVVRHEFGQYAMQRDLDRLNRNLRARGQRLYLDLPVGAGGDGYDTWKHRELFAWGAAAGAPPDDFFTAGQNWGFPPLLPAASTDSGHAYFREVLRHHMRVAGILRIDHVMGLHRLYWVPDGMDAREGVYVRYPREELMAVLAVESAAHDCIVVGEDLGTVPDAVREAMDDHGLLGMYVSEFMQPSWKNAPPELPKADQLAAVDTHDTPTFSGWLHGFDVDRRHQMGLVDDADAEAERQERRDQVENLTGYLRVRGDLAEPAKRGPIDDRAMLEALLRFLGDSDAPVLIVNLDDLVAQTNPQNVPGTMVDRPNWVQRFPLTLEELMADDRAVAAFEAVQACRLGSHLRAKDATP